ncbi:MAG: glucose-1-phosphate thymidylyltransferase, partial [Armatimonadetes bacterium]|nr:glucose-1-phosphate thymidylyltransferase [Armatimonadota bacterium]
DVYLGEGVVLEPGCFVRGPALLLDGAQVRHGAYIRGQVVVGPGATVGHCSELKHSILLAGAAAPHFNYVGDSILGARVNLGAGTVLSNLKLRGATVRVRLEGRCYDTGLRKLGAILGDDTQTGCHTVLNPGTLAGPGSLFYPQANAVGYFAPRSLVRTAVTMGGRD